ncbi:uncharacterized protein LOC34618381 [Cyclospora cayetanensis]|uniref:Uncharacterized protein LOC34618381 n=1 Tax=Cyclospora cayetanensis TaxID=88456 RepID=A0A6P6RYU1_9EIME|nr:uncharacterized protein LOC34618381 [Cyclospora cayetanensis]
MEPLETPSVEQQDQNHENSCKGILEGLAAPLDAVNQLLQLSRCAAFLIAPSAAGRTAALRRLFQALKGLDLAAPPGQYSFGEKPEGTGGPRKELSVNAEQARRASARCVPQDTQQQLQPLSKEKVKALDAPGKKCAEALENACEELGESSLWGPEGWMLRCLQCWESVDLLHGEALVLLLRPHVLVIRLFEKSKEERDIAAAAARGLTRSQRRAIMYTSLMREQLLQLQGLSLLCSQTADLLQSIAEATNKHRPQGQHHIAFVPTLISRHLSKECSEDVKGGELCRGPSEALSDKKPYAVAIFFITLSYLRWCALLWDLLRATSRHGVSSKPCELLAPSKPSSSLKLRHKTCSEGHSPCENYVRRKEVSIWCSEPAYFSEALYRLAETLFEFHDAATAAAHDKKDTLSTQQQCYGYRHQQEKEHQTPALFEHQQQTDFHPGSPTTVVGLLLSFLESQNQTPQYLEAFMQERSPQKELSEHCSSQSADAQVPLSDIQATIAARMLQYLHAATVRPRCLPVG